MGTLYYIICGRHAERVCLWNDGSLGALGPLPPFALPPGFGKEWLKRTMAAGAEAGPEPRADQARWAALLDAFERRHRGCALFFSGDGYDEGPIRLARREAGWGTQKGLALEEEFDLAEDEPMARTDPPGTPAPGRLDMLREINRRPLKEPTPIQWTRTKKPRPPRVQNRR